MTPESEALTTADGLGKLIVSVRFVGSSRPLELFHRSELATSNFQTNRQIQFLNRGMSGEYRCTGCV